MPKINPRIKSIDDLLGLDAAEESPIEPTPSVSLPTKNTIITLPPQAIRAFRGHPFRLYEGDRLNDLVESISEHGVLNPAIIRKIERDEDGFEYEMLAGHNRQNAAAIANRELPCIVKENLSDEDAWIYVIETNVLQRSFSEMLPSEKAAVLALRYSKMICQGRRNDIIEELKRLENPDEIRENPTSGTQCHRTKSRDILGAEYDLKGRAVANYLRINELITPLKRRIDDAEFPIVVAVQLSYLTEQEQKMVDDVLSGSEYKVNEGKVVLLREYTGKLTPERTEQILSGEFNRKPKKSTAIIYDCGVMQTPTSIFRDADHRLLCGSVLPYEIPVFHKALSECGSLEVRPVAICVPQEIQEYCMELFGENVQIAAASHDLFAKRVNGQIYRPLVEKYIAGEKRL